MNKLMAQQTAVEWLYERFLFAGYAVPAEWKEQAKEMEEKQTVNFANDFYDDCVTEGGSLNQSAEEYYNETYKQ
jgi:hypothetical protein